MPSSIQPPVAPRQGKRAYSRAIVVLFVLALLLFIFAWLLIDRLPAVAAPPSYSDESVRQAGDVLKRLLPAIRQSSRATEVTISAQEIDSTTVLGTKVYPWLRGEADLHMDKASLRFSAQLLQKPALYINGQAEIMSSEKGVVFGQIKIGSLPIHPRLGESIFSLASAVLLGRNSAKQILQSIGKIEFTPELAKVEFLPSTDFREHVSNAITNLHATAVEDIDIDTERVQFYMASLVTRERKSRNKKSSLSEVLHALFIIVEKQTRENKFDPRRENESAILALGVFMGPGIFRHFIPGIDTKSLDTVGRPKFILAERGDLAKHFVYSATIKILSNAGASFGIGQAKELVDSGKHGSGFSFADLAADRAGIAFAMYCTQSEQHAQQVQKRMILPGEEADFFPSISGLPEGLSKLDFENQYESTESESYREMIDVIDFRIGQAALYRPVN